MQLHGDMIGNWRIKLELRVEPVSLAVSATEKNIILVYLPGLKFTVTNYKCAYATYLHYYLKH